MSLYLCKILINVSLNSVAPKIYIILNSPLISLHLSDIFMYGQKCDCFIKSNDKQNSLWLKIILKCLLWCVCMCFVFRTCFQTAHFYIADSSSPRVIAAPSTAALTSGNAHKQVCGFTICTTCITLCP